jgi:hypothetical protein
MEKSEVLSLVRSIYTGSTDEAIVYPILDKLEEALPHGDVCNLIFQDMRNLTPEQVVDEALKREAEYAARSGKA